MWISPRCANPVPDLAKDLLQLNVFGPVRIMAEREFRENPEREMDMSEKPGLMLEFTR